MSVIEKWALQGVVVFFFAWMASLVGQWSASVVSATGNERLASLNSVRLSTGSMALQLPSLDSRAEPLPLTAAERR